VGSILDTTVGTVRLAATPDNTREQVHEQCTSARRQLSGFTRCCSAQTATALEGVVDQRMEVTFARRSRRQLRRRALVV
jgi:hypothetical protein